MPHSCSLDTTFENLTLAIREFGVHDSQHLWELVQIVL